MQTFEEIKNAVDNGQSAVVAVVTDSATTEHEFWPETLALLEEAVYQTENIYVLPHDDLPTARREQLTTLPSFFIFREEDKFDDPYAFLPGFIVKTGEKS